MGNNLVVITEEYCRVYSNYCSLLGMMEEIVGICMDDKDNSLSLPIMKTIEKACKNLKKPLEDK